MGRDGARPRLSLEFAASLAPGKFFKVPSSVCLGRLCGASRRRQARQSRRRQHRTLGSLAGSGPGSRRAGPPPRAKAAADAGGSEGGSRPPQLLRPHRGAYTWGLPGSSGRAPRGRSVGGTPGVPEPPAPPRSPRILPSSRPEVPRAVFCVWGPPDGNATRYIPQPPNPF